MCFLCLQETALQAINLLMGLLKDYRAKHLKKMDFSFDLQTLREKYYMLITEDKIQTAVYRNNFNTGFDVNI